jgi:hypothetical protein
MNIRIAALAGAMLLVLAGCPDGNGGDDGGVDAGEDAGLVPNPGGCTGGCGPNQVCDAEGRKCISACNPACNANQLCVKEGTAFVCKSPETSCGGDVCEAGQPVCRGGACSCLSFSEASRDTCADLGQVCQQTYNPVTQEGGSCENPGRSQSCRRDCPGGDCGSCPATTFCDETGFWLQHGFCNRLCESNADCSMEEWCIITSGFCYPKSIFGNVQNNFPGRACYQARMNAQNVKEYFRVSPAALCILTNQNGGTLNAAEDFDPKGTCSWSVYTSDTKHTVQATCRIPGPVGVGGTCNPEALQKDPSTSCDTGLECVPHGRSGQGICAPICNARLKQDGSPGEPGCATGQACMNFHRIEHVDAIPGACLQTCNVFSTETNHGCADLGARQTSCVPTSPRGDLRVTASGNGLCIPQLPTVAAEGQACVETDPFRGAACATGLVCTQVAGEVLSQCVRPCDLECAGATPPARCATEANATCPGGKSCVATSGTTGAVMGFCL